MPLRYVSFNNRQGIINAQSCCVALPETHRITEGQRGAVGALLGTRSDSERLQLHKVIMVLNHYHLIKCIIIKYYYCFILLILV